MKTVAVLLSLLICLHLVFMVLSEDNDNEIILSAIVAAFKKYSNVREDSREDEIDPTSTPQVCIFKKLKKLKLNLGMWKRRQLNFCGNGSTLKKKAVGGERLPPFFPLRLCLSDDTVRCPNFNILSHRISLRLIRVMPNGFSPEPTLQIWSGGKSLATCGDWGIDVLSVHKTLNKITF